MEHCGKFWRLRCEMEKKKEGTKKGMKEGKKKGKKEGKKEGKREGEKDEGKKKGRYTYVVVVYLRNGACGLLGLFR